MTPAPMRFLIIGNPESRRVQLFQAALISQGLLPARVVSYLDLVRDVDVFADLPDQPMLVRIDSPAESFELEKAFLNLGYESALQLGASTLVPQQVRDLRFDLGRILCPRQQHAGFLRLLERLEAIFIAHPRWMILTRPAAIAELFDKRLTSQRYAASGISVPRPVLGVSGYETLRAQMRELGVRVVYVKLSCGSSASCLLLYHLGRLGEYVVTTMELQGSLLYNSRRLRRVDSRSRMAGLIDFLCREGAHVEESVDKLRVDGHYVDCRILCIQGEPAFAVFRQSRHPVTNLHLGGGRADPKALLTVLPAARHQEALESCRRVASLHDAFHVGIDVVHQADLRGHRVLEANAFGDLLPRLSREGLSVYQWQVRAACRSFAVRV